MDGMDSVPRCAPAHLRRPRRQRRSRRRGGGTDPSGGGEEGREGGRQFGRCSLLVAIAREGRNEGITSTLSAFKLS
eukprot:scaffold313592_cov27-Tisochrysis_lutea.AAC.1